MPYLKNIKKKNTNHVAHSFNSANNRIFSPEFSNFFISRNTDIYLILINKF